jgi:pterin-4a-carbinolamine dehydratase
MQQRPDIERSTTSIVVKRTGVAVGFVTDRDFANARRATTGRTQAR